MIFWFVLKLEISYIVIISWRILVSFRGFFEDYIFAWWNIRISILFWKDGVTQLVHITEETNNSSAFMDRDREGSACLTPHWMFHPSRQGLLKPPKIHSDCMGVPFFFYSAVFWGRGEGRGCVNQCCVSTRFGELELLVLVLVSKNQTQMDSC